MIGAASRRRVAAWGVAVACCVVIGLAQLRYVTNFLMGPYALGAADLESITDASQTPRYFVHVTGSKAIDTGIQEITTTEHGSNITASYYALVVGGKLLVCKSSSSFPTAVEGALLPMPYGLSGHLFNTPEMQAHRDHFYPFYLDDAPFRGMGYLAIIGLLILGGLLMTKGRSAWKSMHDPASHPLAVRVAGWGDPFTVALAAEQAVQSQGYKGGGWLMTDQFLIRSTFFTFQLLRLQDLLWAYKRVTKRSAYFIPTGKTYDVILVCHGGTATLNGSEKRTGEILQFAAKHVPWAAFGFSKEVQNSLKKNPSGFYTAIEQRKQEWLQKARHSGNA